MSDDKKNILVLGGNMVDKNAARTQLGLVKHFRLKILGDASPVRFEWEGADVILVLGATLEIVQLVPPAFWGKTILITHDPAVFESSMSWGFLGADRNSGQLLSFVDRALARIALLAQEEVLA